MSHPCGHLARHCHTPPNEIIDKIKETLDLTENLSGTCSTEIKCLFLSYVVLILVALLFYLSNH